MLKKIPKKFYPGILLLGLNIIIWAMYLSVRQNDEMKISFLDIGQGDAIFIEAPNGRQLLIDGGKNTAVLGELGSVMNFFDRTIDVVLATHPDADHVGGLPFVLGRYKVKTFIDSVADADTNVYQKLEDDARELNIPTEFGMRGDVIMLDEKHGVYFHILYPYPDEFKFSETNDLSIVGKLVYGDTSVMLTGDAPKVVENMLVSTDREYLKSSVLKAGHHGSNTSSAKSFVASVGAPYAIISAGIDNTYGHPHPVTMDTLRDSGAEILETSEEGTITFISNGIDIWRE